MDRGVASQIRGGRGRREPDPRHRGSSNPGRCVTPCGSCRIDGCDGGPSAQPPAAPAPVVAAVVGSAATANGALAGKLAGLGLTEAQITGVLALSREVVEQVVWEVVPVLAETMIKEEIRRLTSE